jgi:hypothetical protein
MNKVSLTALAAAILLAMTSSLAAHTTYTGYSSAPGSKGTCASTCHGSSGGTIEVSGFPSEYTPGQAYAVVVAHSGGSAIKQFNGSCRVGTGSSNAGTIGAGTNTSTYNTTGETNGVHLSSIDLDNAEFVWTAPSAGTGEVRLYVAGHQGTAGGANTRIVMVAQEASALCTIGDADGSGGVDIDDVVYLIAYIFTGGPAPVTSLCCGDADGSGGIDIDDVVYVVAYIFTGGPEPDAEACNPPF